jgi:DNA-binding transcriptional ArsR family regulator
LIPDSLLGCSFFCGRNINPMVEYRGAGLDATYAALADPSRRLILERLRQGPRRVSDLAEPFAMSLNAVSKHVKVLERAGLVRRVVRGREHFLHLDAVPLREADAWMERYRVFWEQRLDALEAYLTSPPGEADDRE